MNKKLLGLLLLVTVAVIVIVTYFQFAEKEQNSIPTPIVSDVSIEEIPEPDYLFGFSLDEFQVVQGSIKRNQTFADLVAPYNVNLQDIYTIDKISNQVHSVRRLVPRKDYAIFYKEDSVKRAAYFVYEPDDTEFIVYQLVDSLAVFRRQREVEIVEKTMAGVITQSLDHSIRQEGGSAALVNAVADLFGWQMDMRTLRKGDWFKVIYEDRVVNGNSIGIGNVIGAEFNHINNSYMAYGFDDGNGIGFYDETGESMQKAFLRYPVEYSRISSRYNPRRFHPVLKRTRPHLGTDYAAPKGTPIKAAGDGIITERGFKRGNGNYVYIKHNGTYTTGYLHMSRFGKFRKGQRVKKGEVIGYVGKTGLASGYHLCFRFWKRGKQVDFLREKLPAEEPLPEEQLLRFEAVMNLTNKKLNDIANTWEDRTISASKN